MGGRKSSLRSAADFTRVMSSGRRRHGAWLAVSVAPGTSEQARLGLVIGKRWAKRAVDRNAIKRILREAFRLESASLDRLDIVLRLRQAWPPEARVELAAEAHKLLKGSGL